MLCDIHVHFIHFTLRELQTLKSTFPSHIINCVLSDQELDYGLKLIKLYPEISLSAAIHPQIAEINDKKTCYFLENLKTIPRLCAIGEAGFDIYPLNPSFESQKQIFIKELEIARERNLPVILHCRGAFEELLDLIRKYEEDVPFIFHGYSGGFKYLDTLLKRKYYISFGTPITYEQSRNLRRIAALTPLNRIFSETDSPFNLRHRVNPYKEKNSPENVKEVVKTLSECKRIPEEEMINTISENFHKVFSASY